MSCSKSLDKAEFFELCLVLNFSYFLLEAPGEAVRLSDLYISFFGRDDSAPLKFVSYLSTFEQLILIRNITPSIYFDIPEYKQSF